MALDVLTAQRADYASFAERFDTADISTEQYALDVSKTIKWVDADQSQFMNALMKLPTAPAESFKVGWFEGDILPDVVTLGAAVADGAATSITLTAGMGKYVRKDNLLRATATDEALLVSSVAGDVITVKRGLGNKPAAAIGDGTMLVIVGAGSMQGDGQPEKKTAPQVYAFNYTQIQRDPFGYTRTANESKTLTESAMVIDEKRNLIQHKRALENTSFFGARALLTDTGEHPQGFMGGIDEFIVSNRFNTATLTPALLDLYIETVLQHSSGNVIFFASPIIGRIISGWVRDKWVPNDASGKVYGSKVSGFLNGAYGQEVPVFIKKSWANKQTSTGYGGFGFFVDMEAVKLRPLHTTELRKNIQAPEIDGQDNEYLTETSLEVNNENHHAVLTGVTAGALS